MSDPAPPPLPFPTVRLHVPFSDAQLDYHLWAVEDVDALLQALSEGDDIPYWAVLWESAIGLSEWLIENQSQVRGKHVLELGTGLGLVSLVARALGAQITQTDYDPLALQLAASNAILNQEDPFPQFLMDWRAWDHMTRYEVILGADLLYDVRLHDALLNVLERALAPGGSFILSDPWRDAGWQFADRLLSMGFTLDVQSRHVDWENREKEIMLLIGSSGL